MKHLRKILIVALFFILTQNQFYLAPGSNKVLDGVKLNRGRSTTFDGCMSQASSWASSFRGYQLSATIDGYHLQRQVAIGTEVVELRCERHSGDGMGR